MILMIDNYDSFTFNLVQYLKILGEEVYTVRNDKVTKHLIERLDVKCIFISPGPKAPRDAGECINIIKYFAGRIPIFGVCLGHQCIGETFGGTIVHAKKPMHGKTSVIKSLGKGVFQDFPKTHFIAARYHSLVIDRETLPECLAISCEDENGEIMGVVHRDYNIEGVQFHPEAILTENGYEMLKKYLDKLGGRSQKKHVDIDEVPLEAKLSKSDAAEHKLHIQQELISHRAKVDLYQGFQNLNNANRKFEKCAFIDSAGGPARDCSFSMICLLPQYGIMLKNGRMYLKGENEEYISHLHKVFSSILPKIDEGYDVSNIKFSTIFEAIKNSFLITKSYDEVLPFSFPLVGYFSYEYLHYLETVPRKDSNVLNLPDVELYFYSTHILAEYGSHDLKIIHNYTTKKDSSVDEILTGFERMAERNLKTKYPCQVDMAAIESETKTNVTKEKYFSSVKTALDYIKDGHIFQVQIGTRAEIPGDCEPLLLYHELRTTNPSPYMFYFNTGSYQIISNSPELQFSIINGNAMIRPIAGTSKGKGHDEHSRLEILSSFQNDVKEKAEHVMLVDLARNDIGRMAIPGTVRVDDLLTVEEYSHLFHLTSTVSGKLPQGSNSMELFEATFPAGTLTGAPKIRAMEIISELETEERGPYGGAMGVFDFNGNIKSCIIIRSIIKKDKRLYIQASAGIVSDSKPENEWAEIMHKMRALKQSIAIVKSRHSDTAASNISVTQAIGTHQM